MSIYGPTFCKGENPDNLSDYAKKTYVDARDSTRVAKSGDSMTANLNMGGNLIQGLPTTYPPSYRGDEAASWIQVVNITTDIINTLVKLDGNATMTGDLKMGNHHIKGVLDPVDPQDVATKAYVDAPEIFVEVTKVMKRVTPYFFKLKCGETIERGVNFRDFFIPNQETKFGLEKGRLFVHYIVRHSSGNPIPCSLVRLKLDRNFLKIRFALLGPWSNRLNLYTRIDVLSADTNVTHMDHVRDADGELVDWES